MNCQKNKTKQNKDFDGTYNAKHANVQGVNPSLKATKWQLNDDKWKQYEYLSGV